MIVHPNGSLEGTPEELAAYQAIQERLPEASRHRVRWPQLYPDFYSPPVQGPRFCDDWRAGGSLWMYLIEPFSIELTGPNLWRNPRECSAHANAVALGNRMRFSECIPIQAIG